MTSLPPDLQRYANDAIKMQKLNPVIDIFTQVFIDGVGWRLFCLRTKKQYTPDTYFQEFGVYPELPHPETLLGGENKFRLELVPQPQDKGFKPKNNPSRGRRGRG